MSTPEPTAELRIPARTVIAADAAYWLQQHGFGAATMIPGSGETAGRTIFDYGRVPLSKIEDLLCYLDTVAQMSAPGPVREQIEGTVRELNQLVEGLAP